MRRRGMLRAVLGGIAGMAGCASYEGSSERTPYEAPADTVDPSGKAESTPIERASIEYKPRRIDTRLTVTSKFGGWPAEADGTTDITWYHALQSTAPSYLAPQTERVAADARAQSFLVFNRHRHDLAVDVSAVTLYRWAGQEWEELAVAPDSARLRTRTVTAVDREPALFRFPFDWVSDDVWRSTDETLATGRYAIVVPARFPRANTSPFRLGAVFEVAPASTLGSAGEPTVAVRVENERPDRTDGGSVSAELLEPATENHPATIRVRLRCFDPTIIASAVPSHRSLSTSDDGASRLELVGDPLHEGWWRARTERLHPDSSPPLIPHGSELAVDLSLTAPDRDAERPAPGRYRIDDVFRFTSPAPAAWFSIRYGE